MFVVVLTYDFLGLRSEEDPWRGICFLNLNVVESIPPLAGMFSLLNLSDDEFQAAALRQAVLGVSLALIHVRTLPKTLLAGVDMIVLRRGQALRLNYFFRVPARESSYIEGRFVRVDAQHMERRGGGARFESPSARVGQ